MARRDKVDKATMRKHLRACMARAEIFEYSEVARRARVSYKTVAELGKGGDVKLSTLQAIARGLACHPAHLLGWRPPEGWEL